jgi:hypothetical protein
MAVRRTALTITEHRRTLVQPTLGDSRRHLWMYRRGTRGSRDRSITRLMLTCRRNTRRVTCARHMQYIHLRRTTRSINPLPPLRTQQQGIVPPEGPSPQFRRRIRTINSLCQ